MGRRVPVLALLALACAGAPDPGPAPMQLQRSAAALPGISVGGEPLDARAFAAAAAFLFPEQSRALVRALLRSEFARREALRLGLRVPAAHLEEAVAAAVEGLEGGLPAGQDRETWARERYGRSWREVEVALRRQIEENQLYQLVLRADALLGPRYDCHVLIGREEAQARRWAEQLRAGASPAVLAAASLDPGPEGDGRFPPLPRYLPPPVREAFREASPGTVVGPFQLEGEPVWRVLRVAEILPPVEDLPPVSALLEDLRLHPVTELETRAWFAEMMRRYTAAERLPALVPPDSAFVPAR